MIFKDNDIFVSKHDKDIMNETYDDFIYEEEVEGGIFEYNMESGATDKMLYFNADLFACKNLGQGLSKIVA